jgi:membrane-associated protease RseP (regulator of RpoE activity)
VENTEQPYLFPEIQAAQALAESQPIFLAPARSEVSFSRILLHLGLLFLTAISTTITGAIQAIPDDGNDSGGLLGIVFRFFSETASGHFDLLVKGLLFTFTLLTILGAHELGHYFACRYYGIRATLPFFIPAPPIITLLGTFGAVIKIKEPITTRRALFDIGIAGPLAGFLFAVPASFVGLFFAQAALPRAAEAGAQLVTQDPPLFVLITRLAGLPHMVEWNPFWWAAWGSLFVTALNLFPAGQLDGGHVLYAVLGRRVHNVISWLVCFGCGGLALYAYLVHQPPVYFLWTLVLLFLTKVGHPPVNEEEPLGAVRVGLAVFAAVVFLLCFLPLPLTVK